MIDFGKYFCDDVLEVFVVHLRECEKCREGTRKIVRVPAVGFLLPGDTAKNLINALDLIDKEKEKSK